MASRDKKNMQKCMFFQAKNEAWNEALGRDEGETSRG